MDRCKESKKHKHKSKKSKKSKKHQRKERKYSSSSSEDEWVEKISEKTKSKIDSSSGTSSDDNRKKRYSESSEDEPWLKKHDEKMKNQERESEGSAVRENWFLPTSFLTSSTQDRRKEREIAKQLGRQEGKYDPGKNVRELNPYWKDGGDGLPTVSKFKKPSDNNEISNKSSKNRTSNWRKKTAESTEIKEDIIYRNETTENIEEKPLSDKELNALAAKLVKAELMGNLKLIDELKLKLANAREIRANAPSSVKLKEEDIVLTRTDSKGYSRPVQLQSDYGESSSGKKHKKQKLETHTKGERVRYFADDDKYSLKQMFENEKFHSVEDQNQEFMKLAGKVAKNDDLDEIFADKIRRKESNIKIDQRNKDRAVGEHLAISQSLDNCNRCIQTDSMLKHLMISMSNLFYISLPAHEPLVNGHCLLVPIRHTLCVTQLNEDEWEDLMNLRRAVTKMFEAQDELVVFIETAMYLNRHPHMFLECIPMPRETGDLAPIYFKKAIDESETEWATNKKLISLKGRNVMKAIPKGLPYFSVSFGMEEGFAHVIEDQQLFPKNFAHEILAGMLDLDHTLWRKPRRQSFDEQSKRVLTFTKTWKKFDFTT